MLAVKRVKLPASVWFNRQDKPLPQRQMVRAETAVSEYIPNSQWDMFHGVPKWSVEFDNPELNYNFLEEDLALEKCDEEK